MADGYAYFYLPDSYDIWQVDAVSGLLRYRYRLIVAEGESLIGPVEMDAHGVIHVEQTVTGAHGPRRFNYLIHRQQLLLSSVTHDMARELQATVFASEILGDWSSVLGEYTVLRPVAERDGETTVDWQPATYVSVSWTFDTDKRDIVWIRSLDRLLIHPLPVARHARGWPDSIKNLADLVLLPMAQQENVYFIYNRLDQTLCRRQRLVAQGVEQWSDRWVQPPGLKQIVAVENGYLILDDEGRLFNLSAQGEFPLYGVGEQWLKDHAHWWLALEPLAKRYPVDSFAIVGLRNLAGDGNLSAWCMNGRLLLCDQGATFQCACWAWPPIIGRPGCSICPQVKSGHRGSLNHSSSFGHLERGHKCCTATFCQFPSGRGVTGGLATSPWMAPGCAVQPLTA